MTDNLNNIFNHLSNIECKGSRTKGTILCECGGSTFSIFKRNKTAEEKLEEEIAYSRLKEDYWPFGPVIANDKNGKTIVRKEFLCFKWKERPLSDYMPSVLSFQYVSVKCAKCGKEIILFDGRNNIVGENKNPIKYGDVGEPIWTKDFTIVQCTIDRDETEENNHTIDRLRIYRVKGEKRLLFFDYET